MEEERINEEPKQVKDPLTQRIEDAVDTWMSQYIYGSIVASNVHAVNHVFNSLATLKASIVVAVKKEI